MQYRCPRCKADSARTATTCAACGKPMAPVSWWKDKGGLLWFRRAPDAAVIDYARRVVPFETGLLLSAWILLVATGLGGLWMLEGGGLAKLKDLHGKVQADAREDRASDRVRDDLAGMVEIQDGMAEGIEGACCILLGVGAAGGAVTVRYHFLTRRLAEAGSESPS